MQGPLADAGGATVPADDDAPEIRPYPGLRPFREDESHLFFGRESHRRELLRRLVASRFVAVVGTSGSGKSSLVRAGLFPDLYSGYLPRAGSDWVVVETSPGNDPVGRLAAQFTAAGWPVSPDDLRTNSVQILETAAARLEPDQHLLVLIDQFEELFRLAARDEPVADHDEKASFVRLLLQAGGLAGSAGDARVHVVIAMRSEFLGRASTFRGLPEAIDQGQYLIPRLSREELRKAIVSPAHVASVEVEEALVQRLLSELGDGEDQLPVLQHALMRTWEICRNAGKGALDHTSYEDSGGLEQALSNDASDVLDEAKRTAPPDAGGPGAEGVVRRVFQSLRATDVNGGQTRRPTSVTDLCEIAGCDRGTLERLIEPFRRRSFLLPPPGLALHDETLIDVSHEALLRRWTTLRKWIEEDELYRRLYLRIATRAADEEGSASPDYFAMPLLGLLEKFWHDRQPTRAWAVRHHPGFEAARAFLEASSEHQRLEDVKTNRRARLRLAVPVLALIVIVAGGFAFRLYRSNERLDAQSRVLAAEVIASRAASASESDLDIRTQLAAEALRRRPSPVAQRALLESLFAAARPLLDSSWTDPSQGAALPSQPALSHDGRVLFTIDGASLRATDVTTAAELFRAPRPGEGGLTLIPAGETRLLALSDSAVHVMNAQNGQPIASAAIPMLVAGAVSRDGTTAAFVDRERTIYLCRLESECRDPRGIGRTDFDPADIALSPDGGRAVVSGEDTGDVARSFAIYRMEPFQRAAERALPVQGDPLALALDDNHLWLCSTTHLVLYDVYDNSLDQWQTVSFPRDAGGCAVSPDRAAVLHADRTLRVWDREGSQVAIASVPSGVVSAIAFAGSHVAATGERIRVWDITPYGRIRDLSQAGRLLSDGRHLLTNTTLIDLGTGTETSFRAAIRDVAGVPGAIGGIDDSLRTLVLLPGRGGVISSFNGELILADRQDGTPVLRERWRMRDLSVRAVRPVVSFSAGQRYLSLARAALSDIKILEGRTGAVVQTIEGLNPEFVPGEDAVLVRESRRVPGAAPLQVWPLPGGAPRNLSGDNWFVTTRVGAFAFSHDGKLLAVAEAAESRAEPQQRSWEVRVWNWPTLTPRITLRHAAPVTALRFRGDSAALLTLSAIDSTIHAWDLAKGSEFARVPLPGQSAGARSMAFAPDGRIVIADSDGVTVLPLQSRDWINEACARLPRNLSRDEWELVVGANVEYTQTCPTRP